MRVVEHREDAIVVQFGSMARQTGGFLLLGLGGSLGGPLLLQGLKRLRLREGGARSALAGAGIIAAAAASASYVGTVYRWTFDQTSGEVTKTARRCWQWRFWNTGERYALRNVTSIGVRRGRRDHGSATASKSEIMLHLKDEKQHPPVLMDYWGCTTSIGPIPLPWRRRRADQIARQLDACHAILKAPPLAPPEAAAADRIFDVIDADGSGTIDAVEAARLMDTVGQSGKRKKKEGVRCSEKELWDLFDVDLDRTISPLEFRKFILYLCVRAEEAEGQGEGALLRLGFLAELERELMRVVVPEPPDGKKR